MNKLVLAGAVAVAFAGGAAWWLTTQQPTQSAAVALQDVDDSVDTSSIVEMTMGPADAKVTLVEYASFTCPHCARFHADQFKKLKADYIDTGKVHFIYRDVYFDRYGLWASMVARCGGTDRFFGITDMIYDQQQEWLAGGGDPVEISKNLRKIGKVAGLGEDQLEACLEDEDKAKTLIAWYQKNAAADDVTATPTLVVNGTKQSNMPYDQLAALIDGLLEE